MTSKLTHIGLVGVAILLVALTFISCSNGSYESNKSSINRYNLNEDQLRIQGVLQQSSFKDLDGNTVQITDYAGKIMLMGNMEFAMFNGISSNGFSARRV